MLKSVLLRRHLISTYLFFSLNYLFVTFTILVHTHTYTYTHIHTHTHTHIYMYIGVNYAANALDFFLTSGGVSTTEFIMHSQFSEASALIKQMAGTVNEKISMTDFVGYVHICMHLRI